MTSESSIQTSSVPWQLRQLGKNLSEWIQLQLMAEEQPDPAPRAPFEFPAWFGQLMFACLVAGVVVWLAWLIVQALEQYHQHRQNRAPQPQISLIAKPDERPLSAWLKAAQRYEQEGNWREACRALYMAALQLLHDRDWLPHQPSRTDGEYLQAVQPLPPQRPLQVLIRTHERSLFGGEPLGADNLQRCRRAYEELQKP